jgi:3-hydroxybutyryl-CoA dehydrogenase
MKVNNICVAGAGTMGMGIALCAAQNGFTTLLFDVSEAVLSKAKESIDKNLNTLVSKNKISVEEKEVIVNRISFSSSLQDCKADLIIEAIVEKLDIKTDLFNKLSAINTPEAIFASNTSSLSVNELQKNISFPERVVGMHFFNPAQVMKLVEVVKASQTANYIVEKLVLVCKQMQKTPVVCIDAPGFIVNRVARHYYLEAMRLVESGVATIESVDELMEASGFKMGPFKLMDLIGNDINLAVSQSLYEAFNNEPRFEPSVLQIEKVRQGDLGKKTGKGFYNYNS